MRFFFATLLIYAPVCLAAMAHYEMLDVVVRRSESAFVAQVVAVTERDDGTAFAKTLVFELNPIRTIFGTRVPTSTLTCLYTEGRPHLRGALAVSPLASGSGLEFRVRPGDEMIFLVANVGAHDKAGADACKLLRVEAVQAEALVTSAQTKAARR